jgi:O-antigen ligase
MFVLELLAVAFLAAVALGRAWDARPAGAWAHEPAWRKSVLVLLLAAPLWLGILHLVPVPAGIWAGLAGRDAYLPLLRGAELSAPSFLPLSVAPDVTRASLLMGLPLAAAFVLGYAASTRQLRVVASVVAAAAALQLALGMMQLAGGPKSPLYFGATGGRAVGTFVNPNHLANYLAMALALYVWLAWSRLRLSSKGLMSRRHRMLWLAVGGMVLVLGIAMTRSRGAILFGLTAALLAGVVAFVLGRQGNARRLTAVAVVLIVVSGVALFGLEDTLKRFDVQQFATTASFRSRITQTSLQAAMAFWPWGSGWGTFADVFHRFQPNDMPGYVDFAHQDYVQFLVEGGLAAAALMAAALFLMAHRALLLVKHFLHGGPRSSDTMACAICGLGLLGFLLHSLVEFNMRIPANAILAALLAGVYLRPLPAETHPTHDRPA